MSSLKNAALNYHAAHRAAMKAQTAQDAAYKLQATDRSDNHTKAWLDTVQAHRLALRDEALALGVLVAAALLVPEVF